MVLTIFEWIVVGLIALGGLAIASLIGYGAESITATIISVIIVVIITLASIFGFNWYNTNTASGIRNMKDYTSDMNNGIEREITITAEDGREIFHQEKLTSKRDTKAMLIISYLKVKKTNAI